MHCSLTYSDFFVYLGGAAIRFSFDTSPEKRLLSCPTLVEVYSKNPDPIIYTSTHQILINGQSARQCIFDHIQPVLRKISAADEDDVKSIKIILRIFRLLMFYRGLECEELHSRIKGHIVSRKQMGRALGSVKEQMRLVILERVVLQNERRHHVSVEYGLLFFVPLSVCLGFTIN